MKLKETVTSETKREFKNSCLFCKSKLNFNEFLIFVMNRHNKYHQK
jgi:hypothetical protein